MTFHRDLQEINQALTFASESYLQVSYMQRALES